MNEAVKRLQRPNCITGGDDHLYDRLKDSMSNAGSIGIIVSFLMESGVRMIADDLAEAAKRGARIRILCGNYLNITQPQALYLLKGTLGDKADLRFYDVPNKSFHPKAYIFENNVAGEIFVGSSNISRSALTDGIEWNYRLDSGNDPGDFRHFKDTFEDLFLNKSRIIDDDELKRYSRQWRRPKVYEDLDRAGENTDIAAHVAEFPSPLGAQIEALYELKRSRLEGWDKGIVVAATGLGKTYLAAFDSRGFRKVLFVAHREEILAQSERTFTNARPNVKTGFFTGSVKDKDCDILFASVQTLGKMEYLDESLFKPDEFEYIVIDEFHHAVSDNYMNIIRYFKPKFLLGLTATPERLDNQDVFAVCDYNVIYEARLREAINKGWLAPFRYYGIFDETDYTGIDYKQGKYDESQLEDALSINKRAGLVLENYGRYRSRRALGFCAGRRHAVYMAGFFARHGIKACAVISGDTGGSEHVMERSEALWRFRKGEINVLFSVDMFNEGLDVPDVDMVMFLRPTESPAVFLQQLGRGLRKSIGKKYVNVLDFIGNYRKANLVPFFLTGEGPAGKNSNRKALIPDEEEYPEGCLVNFDLRIIDVFRKIEEREKDAFGRVMAEYFRIRDHIGERPTRLSMYTYLDDGIRSMIASRKELSIFKDYLSFLDKVGDTTEAEKELIGTKAHMFLREIENTSMSKLYKMPVLLAFYNGGSMKGQIGDEDMFRSFREFYSHGANRVDMLRDKSTSDFLSWGRKEYVNLARRNPVHFLLKTSPDFFFAEGDMFCLTKELQQYLDNEVFARQLIDVIGYRTRKFYKERLEKLEKDQEGR